MAAALTLPRVLERIGDRPVMFGGAAVLVAGLAIGPLVADFRALLPLWCILGIGYSLVLTPSGRLLLVFSPHPGRIAQVTEVSIPRPRTFEQTENPEFTRLRHSLRARIFGLEQGRAQVA